MSTPVKNRIARPPIVTVMGHIDHGKSTLLDYIRKTKVTEKEAGGITQHLSAYEVDHTTTAGELRRITFLDTPGHEAFQHLRSRGSSAADLAILVVAADDGVKPQTLEALKAIEEAKIPYIVAISKIDKNNADVERAKYALLEHGVYLEGLGGSVPYVPLSSKTGAGIPELLDLIVLAADVEELTGDPTAPASGLVIESHCDQKRGISAVLLVRDGTLTAGEYVVAGGACAPLRIIEDFRGAKIKTATFSSPIMVVGFSTTPPVGSPFHTVSTKKEATEKVHTWCASQATLSCEDPGDADTGTHFTLPVIIKSDVVGSIEAIKHELRKCENENTKIQVVHEGIGAIAEGDVKLASGSKNTLVVGFNVGVDAAATEMAERSGIEIARFSIIYDLADWVPQAIEARRPKAHGFQELGHGKVLKCFSFAHKQSTIGCRVESGTLRLKDRVLLRRGDEELGRGKIVTLKAGREDVSHVEQGADCGIQLDISLSEEPTYGCKLVAFTFIEE